MVTGLCKSGSHSDQDTLKAVKYFLKNEDVIRKATCLGNTKEYGSQKQHHSSVHSGPLFSSSLTSKDARGHGFRGKLVPILLTTLRAAPCGLFCQIGMV